MALPSRHILGSPLAENSYRAGGSGPETGPGTPAKTEFQRLRFLVKGAVQGVGFRPFVFRLATELRLKGWVGNSPQGVDIEVEGLPEELNLFQVRLERDKPPHALIQEVDCTRLKAVGHREFQIRESAELGTPATTVLPDLATCQDCLGEIFDPSDRRYRYPFTNCTNW